VESVEMQNDASFVKLLIPEEFNSEFVSDSNAIIIQSSRFGGIGITSVVEIKHRIPVLTSFYGGIAAKQGSESKLILEIKYLPNLNSTADIICFFVPAANIIEIQQTKLTSRNCYISIRVRWLSEGSHTMNLFARTIGREQDLIQSIVLVQSNTPKIVYIIPSIGYSGPSITFMVGISGAASDKLRLIVDSKNTSISLQKSTSDDIAEFHFEFRNPLFVGLLNVTVELWETASQRSHVASVFPSISLPKAAIVQILPSFCSISGKTQIILSLAFFNTSLGAPKISIQIGKTFVSTHNYSSQISILCPVSDYTGITQVQAYQGSSVAHSSIEYTTGCPNYVVFCKKLGKLPNNFELATISSLEPCDAKYCQAFSEHPNISVISGTKESYVREIVAFQLKNFQFL
jgi:hypothetical protein